MSQDKDIHVVCLEKTVKAKNPVEAERRRSLGKDYHPLCLKCHHCKRQLTPGQHAEHDDKPYCTHCYLQRFGPRGARPSRLRSSFGTSSSSRVPAQI